MLQNPHVLLTFDKVHNPLRLPRETTSVQKWSVYSVFCTFRLRNVLRATTACISTAKNGPYMVCFVHFDLQMCFAPRRRALFRHLNCQKWSGPSVCVCFVHFDFEMCFAPQQRALFRHLNFQKRSGAEVFCTF